MKKILLTLSVFLILGNVCFAQYTNWNSERSGKQNSVFLNIGYDYSLSIGGGYNRSMTLFTRPVLLGMELSKPMGDHLIDDYKINLGAEIEVFSKNNFSLSACVKGIIRRNETEFSTMENFGSDLGLKTGFYKPNWYIAGEFGFDKAISSHIEHSDLYKDLYPQVEDGWYVPSGGQYYYGLTTGFSIREILDLSLKAGLTNAEGPDTNALLPYYVKIGINRSF